MQSMSAAESKTQVVFRGLPTTCTDAAECFICRFPYMTVPVISLSGY